MNIKIAIQWANWFSKEQRITYCVLSTEQIGIYTVVKETEVTDETKVVYSL